MGGGYVPPTLVGFRVRAAQQWACSNDGPPEGHLPGRYAADDEKYGLPDGLEVVQINMVFAKVGLATYSLQVPDHVTWATSSTRRLPSPSQRRRLSCADSPEGEHHWRLNLQSCTFRELLNDYGGKLSVMDLWNLVGPSKENPNAKRLFTGFPVIQDRKRGGGCGQAQGEGQGLDGGQGPAAPNQPPACCSAIWASRCIA